MRVAASIFACTAAVAVAYRVQRDKDEVLGHLTSEVTEEAQLGEQLDSEYWLNCKSLPFPGQYQFSRLEKAPGKEKVMTKYLPMEAGGQKLIFSSGGGKWKIDTSAVKKGAGIMYRTDKDPKAIDPTGVAVEDGDVVSGTEDDGWLKVVTKINSYTAKGVLAMELTEDTKLHAHAGQQWRYEVPGASRKKRAKTDLTWKLVGKKGADETLDLTKDVKFVKRVWNRPPEHDELTKKHQFDPEPATIEFHYENGEIDSFYGGVYYNPDMTKLSILQGSFEQFDSGVAAKFKKKESLPKKKDESDEMESDVLSKVKDNCLKWEWCAGFTYDPRPPAKGKKAVSPTVYYLDSWGDGPVGKSSAKTSSIFKEKNPSELKNWVSYKYGPTDSKGVMLDPRVNLGSYWSMINSMKDGIMEKKLNFTFTVPEHPIDQTNLQDFTMGTGKISKAIGKVGESLPPPEKVGEVGDHVPREAQVKTWGYRMYMMVGSETFYSQLKCAGMKTCSKDGDLMVPKGQKCPKKVEKGSSPL